MVTPNRKKQTSAPRKEKKRFHAWSSTGFSLLKDILSDPVGKAWDELCEKGPRAVLAYQRLWELVLESQEFIRHPRMGTGLQDHWLERLLDDPNPFHRKAELTPYDQITPALAREYADELMDFINHVLRKDFEPEVAPFNDSLDLWTPTFGDMKGLPTANPFPRWMEERRKIKEKILTADDPGIVREVARYFYQNGFGMFGCYRAFRWEAFEEAGGQLVGIEFADSIRLENLVGYDAQRRPLLENIEAFVSGKPANNVLIYGERGTGKSSTVKALLNAYEERGLRLVEVSPADLMDYPHILRALRGRRERFILFVDDLSFEENETQYKGLKALLEGSVEATPPNVILVATSNRRHLVREFFAEREEGIHEEGEVRGQDTVEEKLSLADRFGLVVSFYAPDQDTYLRIVDQWAQSMGISLSKTELHARAVLWARRNNGPSGRAARQFINDLRGRI
jgi:predicted AAA+ superfamily ATPase